MSSSCTPILVGVAILVSEILLLSKAAKFSFRTMDGIKLNQIESAQKIPASRHACTASLVGVASPALEILLLFCFSFKFPF